MAQSKGKGKARAGVTVIDGAEYQNNPRARASAATKRKRAAQWSDEKYRIALQGDELPGLRSTARGFGASDGYDLRKVDDWSPAKKRKVRDSYEKMYHLLAQSKRVVRPRSKQNLRTLQDSFHGDIPSREFKVAFVPYTDPTPLPGAKRSKPRIRYTQRGVVFDTGAYARHFEAFDKTALAKKPDAEIKRAIAQMPEAKLFFIQSGQFQTLNGKSAGLIAQQVKQYMQQYDGKTPLPRGSGNRGDSPKSHHWKYWLEGIHGYSFGKRIDIGKMQRTIVDGMKEAKARRKRQDTDIRKLSKIARKRKGG